MHPRGIQRAVVVSALVIVLNGILVVPSAGAAGPVITSQPFGATNVPFFGANEAGCTGFEARVTYTGTRRFIRFYDETGTLQMERRHVRFTGTVFNSDTGTSVPYQGRFTRTFDAVARTVTFTGLRLQVVLPGQGVVALDAGTEVLSFPDLETLVERGPHSFHERICAVLA